MPLSAVVGIFLGMSGSPLLFWTSIAAAAMFIFVIAWLYKINEAPIVFVVLSPIGAVVVAWILFGAASMLLNKKPICWGGREYILEPRSK
jgi:hypothetical protein